MKFQMLTMYSQEIRILRKMTLKVGILFILHVFIFSPNLKSFWTTFVEKLMNKSKSMALPLALLDFEIFPQETRN